MNKKVQSDFLFAQPSFTTGAARIVDLWGDLDDYNGSETPVEADTKAIASDWIVVGQEIVAAVEHLKPELETV